MKISAQEEYGLRILLRIAKSSLGEGLTISGISELENLTTSNTAKILRILRLSNMVKSTRGNTGGYELAKPASEIDIGEVLKVLGGNIYDEQFCTNFKGVGKLCNNSIDCTIRSLWQLIQLSVNQVVGSLTLSDLISPEEVFKQSVMNHLNLKQPEVLKN